MKSLFNLLIVILFLSYTSLCQEVTNTSPETEWQLVPCVSAAPQGLYQFNTRTLERSVIPVSNGNVYPVQFGKEEYGIVLADNKGNAKWETRTKGFVIGIGKVKEQLICFYSPEWNNGAPGKMIRNLYAGFFDAKTGKQISEKEVLVNRTEWNVDPKVMVGPDLQFTHLLIRYSQFVNSKLFVAKETEKLLTTEKIQLISMNGSQEFKTIDIPSQAVKSRFITCAALSADELVIASENDDIVTTERFNVNDPSHPKKSTFAINTFNQRHVHPNGLIKYDPATPGLLYEAICYFDDDYNKHIAIAKLDLTTDKFTVSDVAMNKELAETFATDSKKNDRQFAKTIHWMNLVDLVIQKDNILLLSQVHALMPGPDKNRPTYGNNEIMISSFDVNLKKTRSMIVSRHYEIFLESGEKFGYEIDGDKMHLFYNVVSGIARIGCEYAIVDLKSFIVTDKVLLQKEGLRADANIEPQAIVWSHDAALVPYNNMAGTKNGETVFQYVKLKK